MIPDEIRKFWNVTPIDDDTKLKLVRKYNNPHYGNTIVISKWWLNNISQKIKDEQFKSMLDQETKSWEPIYDRPTSKTTGKRRSTPRKQ